MADAGAASRTRAARCASARTPACSSPARSRRRLYGSDEISERHRHRYEVNNDYREPAAATAGLVVSRPSTRTLDLVEMIELADHPCFVGCQFHPEFKSKPFAPHPLFSGFIRAGARAARRARAPMA